MLQEQYRIFLSEIYEKNKNGDHLSPSSVNHYAVESIRKINEVLSLLEPTFTSLYDVESIEELTRLKKVLLSNPEFVDLDTRGNRMYSAGFNRFMDFALGQTMKGINKKIGLMDIKEPIPDYVIKKESITPNRDRIKIRQVVESFNYMCGIDNKHTSFIAESTGMNRNSAVMYLYAVQGMLDGTIYKRAISAKAMRKYYDTIWNESGSVGLKRAIQATRLHIQYRRECGHTVDSIEEICKQYESKI